METKTTMEISIDSLSANNVVIIYRTFTECKEVKVEAARYDVSYKNSEAGRDKLLDEQFSDIANAVFAVWGKEPTIVENEAETK